jgi:hypothetical protein
MLAGYGVEDWPVWQKIKNAFIPWNFIKPSDNTEHSGVRTVDYGQLIIDGTTGGVTDMTRIIGQAEKPLPRTDAPPPKAGHRQALGAGPTAGIENPPAGTPVFDGRNGFLN